MQISTAHKRYVVDRAKRHRATYPDGSAAVRIHHISFNQQTGNGGDNMECPICKSNTVIEIRRPTFSVRGNVYVDHYECDGCSVMFKEKDKFYRKTKAEPICTCNSDSAKFCGVHDGWGDKPSTHKVNNPNNHN